jgi:hypothetical protein
MMLQELVKQLKNDCAAHGYGRKKWWADQLGVPPLTLSHWFSGRQNPNGESALGIKNILTMNQQDKKAEEFKGYLWGSYNRNEIPPPFLASEVVLGVLSKTTLDSRTLALLSVFSEKTKPSFNLPVSGFLKNRLGWLLEVSGQKSPFTPESSLPAQDILENSDRSSGMKKYLRRFQTKLGKKWKLYDCPLKEMKESLPWNRN